MAEVRRTTSTARRRRGTELGSVNASGRGGHCVRMFDYGRSDNYSQSRVLSSER